MKKNWCFHLILITIMVLFFQNGALAESQTKPIQLSIFDPIQIFNSDTSIHGFRFNLIYGFNRDVSGLDLGFANRAKGDMNGLQWGAINIVEGNATSFQWGLFNTSRKIKGFQLGVINHSEAMRGLQLGVINTTGDLYGLQIGVLNFNWSGDPLTFFPIINFSF